MIIMNKSFQRLYNSPLNKSTTKEAHRFGTSPRFPKDRHTPRDQFYRSASISPKANPQKSDTMSRSKRFLYQQKEVQQKSRSPSPFSNNLSKSKEKNCQNTKFTKSQRFSSQRIETPGPGSYETPMKSQSSVRIPKEKRILEFNVPKSSVGPGAYNVGLKNQNKSCIFTKQQRFKEKNRKSPTPGPGQYISPLKASRSSAHNFSFQRASRVFQFETKDTPGPGTYDEFSQFSLRTAKIIDRLKRL